MSSCGHLPCAGTPSLPPRPTSSSQQSPASSRNSRWLSGPEQAQHSGKTSLAGLLTQPRWHLGHLGPASMSAPVCHPGHFSQDFSLSHISMEDNSSALALPGRIEKDPSSCIRSETVSNLMICWVLGTCAALFQRLRKEKDPRITEVHTSKGLEVFTTTGSCTGSCRAQPCGLSPGSPSLCAYSPLTTGTPDPQQRQRPDDQAAPMPCTSRERRPLVSPRSALSCDTLSQMFEEGHPVQERTRAQHLDHCSCFHIFMSKSQTNHLTLTPLIQVRCICLVYTSSHGGPGRRKNRKEETQAEK